jgi:sulfide dehydrogenase cytochrome subunit
MNATDRCGFIAVTVGAIFVGSAAHAADTAAREWAATCLSCHQPGTQAVPLLHGQTREALVSKLRAFRDGTLPGTVMPQLVKGYSDAQMQAIAGWFAAASSGLR